MGVGPTAKKLFDEIQQESAVILNFENIEFIANNLKDFVDKLGDDNV